MSFCFAFHIETNEEIMSEDKKMYKKFMLFWFGSLVAAVGSGMTAFALGVHVFQITGLTSSKVAITLLGFLPNVLLAPFAGVLADKYDRRKLMILGDGLSALGVLLILVSMIYGFESYWIIGLGVLISSIFSSLIDPASKATITELVSAENYTKASGLIQLAHSARYLISPIVAAFLLSYSSIKIILILDILTIVLTIITVSSIGKNLQISHKKDHEPMFKSLKNGFKSLRHNKPLYQLILISFLITFSIGFIEELSTPLILTFANEETLGIGMAVAATGLFASSLLISIKNLKYNPIKTLVYALMIAGVCMIGFGLRENIITIGISGFLFFATLPFLNASVDYLVRINTPNDLQGRIWGMVSIISQMGYIASYLFIGPLSDFVFRPMLDKGGILASSVGRIIGVGSGRGMGLLIIIAGLFLLITTYVAYKKSRISELKI